MTERPFNDISFNQFLAEEKLMGARCVKCGSRFVPPRPLCTRCRTSDLEWVEVEGKGKLVAFTCITIAPPFMAAQGYGRKNPYCSGVVELESGEHVDARIEGVDATMPEDIKLGTPMRARYIHRKDVDPPETYLAFERL